MLSCMVVFSSIDINSALNDSLGMLVLSALPSIGSKIYSWHIQDSEEEIGDHPMFLSLELEKKQVMFSYSIAGLTAIIIGTM